MDEVGETGTGGKLPTQKNYYWVAICFKVMRLKCLINLSKKKVRLFTTKLVTIYTDHY